MNNHQNSIRSHRRSRSSRTAVTLSVMLLSLISGISSAQPPTSVSASPTERGQPMAGEVQQSGSNQRFMLPARHRDRLPFDATVLHDYGNSILIEVPAGHLQDLQPLASELEDFSRLNYRAWSGDITSFEPNHLEDARDAYFLLALAGPLDKQWIETIEASGVRTVDHVNPYGLLVRGDADRIRHVAERLKTSLGHAVITSALPLPGDSRVSEELAPWLSGQREAGDIGLRHHEGTPLVTFVAHGDADVESLAAQLSDRLVPGPEFKPGSSGLQFAATPSVVRSLLDDHPEIAFVHGVYPRVLHNNLAAQEHMTNIEPVWNEPSLGYTGDGIIVGVNDSGLDMTHPDFPPEAVVATSGVMSAGLNAHGTHVAGTVAGRGTVSSPYNDSGCGDQSTPLSAPRGMAWESRISHNNLFDGGIGGVTQMMQWHAEQGADLTNNSWGFGNNFNYVSESGAVDASVRSVDPSAEVKEQMIMVFAAGNAGPAPGTIGAPGNAKNVITVGASQNDRCGAYIPSMCDGPDIDTMACFSGRGPAQQRIKPDVVAPGTGVLSTGSRQHVYVGDQEWTGPDLQLMPGTSMASPVVAGAAAIFLEYFDDRFGGRPSPALVRGIFINTATDMGMGFPSMDQGWGRINLRKAIEGPEHGEIRYFEQDQVDHLATGESWETTIEVLSSDEPFRTTLTWTDPPGSEGCDPCHINDLDLIVTAPDGTVFRGNEFDGHWSEPNPSGRDSINNAENVYVESPQTGEWLIEVYSVNTAQNPPDLGGQDFALVTSSATGLTVDPVHVSFCTSDGAFDAVLALGGGFEGTTDLSVSGVPAGASGSFDPNPVIFPDTESTFSFTDLDQADPGSAIVEFTATDSADPTNTADATMQLDLMADTPDATELLAPADGEVGKDFSPELSWSSVSDVDEYRVEMATSPAFDTIVYSQVVSGTDHIVSSPLDPGTEYFWRVTAINGCGESSASTPFSFTTGSLICSAPDATIPTDGSVSDTIEVDATATLENLKVSVDLTFEWVGDLVVTLEHVESGTTVDLINRPGVNGEPFGCGRADIDALFDDLAEDLGNDMCSTTPPAIGGEVQPLDDLADFDGEQLQGAWALTVTETGDYAPDGTLNEWCLLTHAETDPQPEIVVDPEAFAVNLPVDTQHTEHLEILNAGHATLEWSFDAAPDPDHQASHDQSTLLSNGCSSPAEIDWLDVDPVSGSTAEGASSTVDMHFDSDGLAGGTHEALLCVNSNDPENDPIEVPVSLSVGAGQATQLAFEVQPSTFVAGEFVKPAVTVEVRDGFGEIVSSDNDTVVELTLAGGDAAAQLSGTVSVQVSGGVAVFDDLVVDTPGTGYSLLAADAQDELDAAVSSEFTVLDSDLLHDRFEEIDQ